MRKINSLLTFIFIVFGFSRSGLSLTDEDKNRINTISQNGLWLMQQSPNVVDLCPNNHDNWRTCRSFVRDSYFSATVSICKVNGWDFLHDREYFKCISYFKNKEFKSNDPFNYCLGMKDRGQRYVCLQVATSDSKNLDLDAVFRSQLTECQKKLEMVRNQLNRMPEQRTDLPEKKPVVTRGTASEESAEEKVATCKKDHDSVLAEINLRNSRRSSRVAQPEMEDARQRRTQAETQAQLCVMVLDRFPNFNPQLVSGKTQEEINRIYPGMDEVTRYFSDIIHCRGRQQGE